MNEVVAQPAADTSLLNMIERVALDPNVSLERLERLMDMQERAMERAAKATHAEAVAAAMAEMPGIPMTGLNKHTNQKYATLKDITSATRKPLAKHGLSLTFDIVTNEKSVTVTACLTHRLGYEKRVPITLPSDTGVSKNPVQAFGSTITYGERYTAQAILGLSLGEDTDDDGVAAGVSSQTISEDQLLALLDLMDQAGGDQPKFLKFFKVAAVADLPIAKYGSADAMLRKKIADAKAKDAA